MVVWAIWAVSAFTSKRTVRRQSGAYRWLELLALLGSFELSFNTRLRRGLLAWRFAPDWVSLPWIGFAIEVAGVAFAVWARYCIGRNWSSDVTIKEDHQLMRGGPYAIVRHPIYAGFVLAMAGTAMAIGEVRALIGVPLLLLVWHHKAVREEQFMLQQFGDEYERYRREVKGLIPYIW